MRNDTEKKEQPTLKSTPTVLRFWGLS